MYSKTWKISESEYLAWISLKSLFFHGAWMNVDFFRCVYFLHVYVRAGESLKNLVLLRNMGGEEAGGGSLSFPR